MNTHTQLDQLSFMWPPPVTHHTEPQPGSEAQTHGAADLQWSGWITGPHSQHVKQHTDRTACS